MIVSHELAKQKGWEVVLVLSEPGAKDGDFFGEAVIPPTNYAYEGSKETVKTFSFMLKAKYFRQAKIRAWSDDVDSFELRLHKANEKAEQGGVE